MADPFDTPGYRFALNRYAGDGVTTQWDISFAGVSPGYISQDHVRASVVDDATGVETPIILTPANFILPTRLQITPPVPVGSTLVIRRDSPKNQPMLDYVDGALMIEKNLDTSNQQTVYAVAEMVDRFADSLDVVEDFTMEVIDRLADVEQEAETAASNASAAVATANAANTKADAAVQTAADALAGVTGAEQAAILATEAANAANNAATLATQAAVDAEATAAASLATAQNAVDIAQNAEDVANGIDGKAQSALDASATAVATANAAEATANGIDAKATQALSDAAAAVSTANSAMTQTILSSAADANTLTTANTRYIWTDGAVVNNGTNWPSLSGLVARGFMDVVAMSSSQIYQRLVCALSSNVHPIVFERYGMVGSTWYSWSVAGPWSPATFSSHAPTADYGDLYVDGVGWHGWDAGAQSYLPLSSAIEKNGGTINGALSVSGAATVAGVSNLNGGVSITNSSGAAITLKQPGIMEQTLRVSSVGFDIVNADSSHVNMSVRDSNGDGVFRGSVYAANGGAVLFQDGNVNGPVWGGWLSTWLNNQLSLRPQGDGTSYVGFAGRDIRFPYMRHDSTDTVITLIRNTGGVYGARRMEGYLECDTDAGVVGINYFVSDERTKRDIMPATARATDLVSRLVFYSFRFKEGDDGKGNDPTKVHQIGVLAKDIQKLDPSYVDELSDGTLQPNIWNLLTLALKGLQEANERIASLEKRLGI